MKNWEVGAELLVDLADNLTTMLTDKLNVPEIKAKAVAQEATALIADNWAAVRLYSYGYQGESLLAQQENHRSIHRRQRL